ncbi:hypothetical protein SAMD00019534_081700 [Acytostelium subglobosum LB1]|uniref:hypothetical protein n=1 Tax=Acytostelium subglobosum LB1 TaxID=1410327 RepID=UPI000644C4C8|nr:hypothetical protein SAMD00019534_081700 [Acytostelium subglobosum LB1]GAM24995.1 hypothetical protein SAMD00019534_081700 [Acytostelium subglobosum LB1]|eukprot:XP_012752084.1 hypothetical protein SAMD00019534_081700 [Acytostelium subglobosum LB1]
MSEEKKDDYIPVFHYRGALSEADVDKMLEMELEAEAEAEQLVRGFVKETKNKRGRGRPRRTASERASSSGSKRKHSSEDYDDIDFDHPAFSQASQSQSQQSQSQQSQSQSQQQYTSESLEDSSSPIMDSCTFDQQSTDIHTSNQSTIATSSNDINNNNNNSNSNNNGQFINLDDDDDCLIVTPSITSSLSSMPSMSALGLSSSSSSISNVYQIDDPYIPTPSRSKHSSKKQRQNTSSQQLLQLQQLQQQAQMVHQEQQARAEISKPIDLHLKLVGEPTQTMSINNNSPIKELVEKYCKAKHLDYENIQLKMYGFALEHSKTPMELDLFDGDTIDVTIKEVEVPAELDLTSSATLPMSDTPYQESNADDTNKLLLILRHEGTSHKFKIGKGDTFEKLLSGFQKKVTIPAGKKITLKFDGLALNLKSTPEDEDMDDDDLIDVSIK